MVTNGKYIYFLLFDNIVKMGFTTRPSKRLKTIKQELINKGFVVKEDDFDYLLLIPNASNEMEINLQKLFNEYHIDTKFYSQEWFRYEGLIKKFVVMYNEYENKYHDGFDMNMLMFELLKNRLTSHTERIK